MMWNRRARVPALPVWIVVGCLSLARCERPVEVGGGRAQPRDGRITNSIGMSFTKIPAGSGCLGSPVDEPYRATCYNYVFPDVARVTASEREARRYVTLKHGFWLGVTEVTNQQYRRHKPGHKSVIGRIFDIQTIKRLEANAWNQELAKLRAQTIDGGSQPATCVTWDDAQRFCAWLSSLPAERMSGRSYRLPTEDEWEYACRARSNARFFWGEDDGDASEYANLADRSGASIWRGTDNFGSDDKFIVSAPVGSFRGNAFGLHDMLGNVWEICSDDFRLFWRDGRTAGGISLAADERPAVALRGGSWCSGRHAARCAARFPIARNRGRYDAGFRAVLIVGGRAGRGSPPVADGEDRLGTGVGRQMSE